MPQNPWGMVCDDVGMQLEALGNRRISKWKIEVYKCFLKTFLRNCNSDSGAFILVTFLLDVSVCLVLVLEIDFGLVGIVKVIYLFWLKIS